MARVPQRLKPSLKNKLVAAVNRCATQNNYNTEFFRKVWRRRPVNGPTTGFLTIPRGPFTS